MNIGLLHSTSVEPGHVCRLLDGILIIAEGKPHGWVIFVAKTVTLEDLGKEFIRRWIKLAWNDIQFRPDFQSGI
jgi:hypothetical protein